MKIYQLIPIVFSAIQLNAQNVGIGTKNPLSKLHVAGDVRVDSLANKESGIVIHYNNGILASLKFTGKTRDVLRGDGTFHSLDAVAATSPNWLTTGNAGTDTGINFIGTSDNSPLRFRVNNIRAGELNPMNNNISFGTGSLLLNKNGFGSIAIGSGALGKMPDAQEVVAIGDSAMYNQTKTTYVYTHNYNNLAIGGRALYANIEGLFNTAVGYKALTNNLASGNTALGYGALSGNTNGSANTALGSMALNSNATGSDNVAVGRAALNSNLGGNRNVAVGYDALVNNDFGNSNTAIGYYAMHNNLQGSFNTAYGSESLLYNMVGSYNTVHGYAALQKIVNGNNNTAIGAFSLFNNTVSYNTAIGDYALYKNTEGSGNTAMGSTSLYSNKLGNENTAIGFKTLYSNVSGSKNVALGYQVLYENQNGSSNVAVGYQASFKNVSGVSNTSIGTQALYRNTTGVNNAAIGYGALKNNATGFQNTAVGMYADVTLGNLYNATAIGYNAKVNASNKVRIGNSAVTKIEGQVPFSTPSDGRYKFNVKEDVRGLDFILRLRPVTYQFDVNRFDGTHNNVHQVQYTKALALRRTGFIAQEVERAARQSNYDFSGISRPESEQDHFGLSYESFVVPLVKGMQEQQQIIAAQQSKITALEEMVQELIKKIQLIEDGQKMR